MTKATIQKTDEKNVYTYNGVEFTRRPQIKNGVVGAYSCKRKMFSHRKDVIEFIDNLTAQPMLELEEAPKAEAKEPVKTEVRERTKQVMVKPTVKEEAEPTKQATSATKEVKPTKPTASPKKSVKNAKQVQTATAINDNIVSVLEKRLVEHEAISGKPCKTLQADIKFFKVTGTATVQACIDKNIDLTSFIDNLHISDRNNTENYIAVKVITKFRQMLKAIAMNSSAYIDGYSNAILITLIQHKELTSFECQQALSSNIINESNHDRRYNALKRVRSLKVTAPSTAHTQTCSTRMMLKILGICEVNKNVSDDVIKFKNNEIASMVKALFENEMREKNIK